MVKQTPIHEIHHNYYRQIIHAHPLEKEIGKTEQTQPQQPKIDPSNAVKVNFASRAYVGPETAPGSFLSLYRLNVGVRQCFFQHFLNQPGAFQGLFHGILAALKATDPKNHLKLAELPPTHCPLERDMAAAAFDSVETTAPQYAAQQKSQWQRDCHQEQQNRTPKTSWQGLVKTMPHAEHYLEGFIPINACKAIQTPKQTNIHGGLRLPAGFIYLFQNGHLLEEFAIDADGTVYEVPLAAYAGQDTRPAKTDAYGSVILDKTLSYQIAYSSVQWSWARVNYFGGLEAHDSRIDQAKAAYQKAESEPNDTNHDDLWDEEGDDIDFDDQPELGYKAKEEPEWVSTISNTAANRLKRMGPPIVLSNINIHHAEPKTQQAYTQSACCLEPDVITFFLADPIGLAKAIAQDLNTAYALLESTQRDILQQPFSDSAVLAYQSFYNPSIAYRTLPNPGVAINDLSDTVDGVVVPPIKPNPIDNIFKRQQTYLNEPAIRAVLQVRKRRQIRYWIRCLQAALVQQLCGDQFQSTSQQTQHRQQGITNFNIVAGDYFSLGWHHYEEAFALLSSLFSQLPCDPSCIDNNLDIVPDEIDPNLPKTADHNPNTPSELLIWPIGARYLATFEPIMGLHYGDNALAAYWLPLVHYDNGKTRYSVQQQNDGNGHFSLARLATAYQAIQHYRMINDNDVHILSDNRALDISGFDHFVAGNEHGKPLKIKPTVKVILNGNLAERGYLGAKLIDLALMGIINAINRATFINSPSPLQQQQLLHRYRLTEIRINLRDAMLNLAKATGDNHVQQLEAASTISDEALHKATPVGAPYYPDSKPTMDQEARRQKLERALNQRWEQQRSLQQEGDNLYQARYKLLQQDGVIIGQELRNLQGPRHQLFQTDYIMNAKSAKITNGFAGACETDIAYHLSFSQMRQHNLIMMPSKTLENISGLWASLSQHNTATSGVLLDQLNDIRGIMSSLLSVRSFGSFFFCFQLYNLFDCFAILKQNQAKPKHHVEQQLEDWLRLALLTQDLAVTAKMIYRDAMRYGNITRDAIEWATPKLQPLLKLVTMPKPNPDTPPQLDDWLYQAQRSCITAGKAYLNYMGIVGGMAITGFCLYDVFHSHNGQQFLGNVLMLVNGVGGLADGVRGQIERVFGDTRSSLEIDDIADQSIDDTTSLSNETRFQYFNSDHESLKKTSKPSKTYNAGFKNETGSTGGLDTSLDETLSIFSGALGDTLLSTLAALDIIGTIALAAYFAYEFIITEITPRGLKAWCIYGPFGCDRNSSFGPWLLQNIPQGQTWFQDSNHYIAIAQKAYQHMLKDPKPESWGEKYNPLNFTGTANAIMAKWLRYPAAAYLSLLGSLSNPKIIGTEIRHQENGITRKTLVITVAVRHFLPRNCKITLKAIWAYLQPELMQVGNAESLYYKVGHYQSNEPDYIKQIINAAPPHNIIAIEYHFNYVEKVTEDIPVTKAVDYDLQLLAAAQVEDCSGHSLPQPTIDDLIDQYNGLVSEEAALEQDGYPSLYQTMLEFDPMNPQWVHMKPMPTFSSEVTITPKE